MGVTFKLAKEEADLQISYYRKVKFNVEFKNTFK